MSILPFDSSAQPQIYFCIKRARKTLYAPIIPKASTPPNTHTHKGVPHPACGGRVVR